MCVCVCECVQKAWTTLAWFPGRVLSTDDRVLGGRRVVQEHTAQAILHPFTLSVPFTLLVSLMPWIKLQRTQFCCQKSDAPWHGYLRAQCTVQGEWIVHLLYQLASCCTPEPGPHALADARHATATAPHVHRHTLLRAHAQTRTHTHTHTHTFTRTG